MYYDLRISQLMASARTDINKKSRASELNQTYWT